MSDNRYDRSNRSTSRGNYGHGRPAAPQPLRKSQQSGQGSAGGIGGPGRRVCPVWFLIVMDILLIGVALNVFALLHHIIPMSAVDVGDNTQTIAPIATMSPKPSALQTQAVITPTDSATGAQSTDTTATPDADATPVPADVGMWGDKFADKFATGDPETTANSYKSHDISVTVNKVSKNGIVYFVSDIYLRNVENFMSGFANNKFSVGQRETTVSQAKRLNAVIAINGDDYGDRYDGVVLRNGQLRRSNLYGDADLLVMYKDGTMKTFTADNFKLSRDSENALNIWDFGPMLLDSNGNSMTKFNSSLSGPNPRTAIGYYEPGHYCFVLVDGSQATSGGIKLLDLSALFKDLGCTAAYNLDGGRTSVMAFMGNVTNSPLEGGNSTSDIIYIGETGN